MNAPKKIFISQPFNGKTDDEIKDERKAAEDYLHTWLEGENFEIIPIITDPEDTVYNASSLWWLGRSIEDMSYADVVFFAKGWENARGCKIEHLAARKYNRKIMEYHEDSEDEED